MYAYMYIYISMCIYVFICIYIYTYVYMYMYIHGYIYIYIHVYIYISVHTCALLCCFDIMNGSTVLLPQVSFCSFNMCIIYTLYICKYMCKYIAHIFICIHIYVCTNIYIYMCVVVYSWQQRNDIIVLLTVLVLL